MELNKHILTAFRLYGHANSLADVDFENIYKIADYVVVNNIWQLFQTK